MHFARHGAAVIGKRRQISDSQLPANECDHAFAKAKPFARIFFAKPCPDGEFMELKLPPSKGATDWLRLERGDLAGRRYGVEARIVQKVLRGLTPQSSPRDAPWRRRCALTASMVPLLPKGQVPCRA
jgi:hypothetical protein